MKHVFVLLSALLLPFTYAQTQGPFVFAYHAFLEDGTIGLYANASYEPSVKDITILADGIVRNVCQSSYFCSYKGKFGPGLHTYYAVAVSSKERYTSHTNSFTIAGSDGPMPEIPAPAPALEQPKGRPVTPSVLTAASTAGARIASCGNGACEPGERTTCLEDCVPGICHGGSEPVCGVDGRTYYNDCYRRETGTEVLYRGACENVLPKISDVDINPDIPDSSRPTDITAYATDAESGIGEISIYVDGLIEIRCAGSPCRTRPNLYKPGMHRYSAAATDKTGNIIVRDGDFFVDDRTPPNILSSVRNRDTEAVITSTASDTGAGVHLVDISVDGVLVRTCTSSPCVYSGTMATGMHTYEITAMDRLGNSDSVSEEFRVSKNPFGFIDDILRLLGIK